LVAEYQQLVDAGLRSDADKLLDQSNDIKGILAKTGYQLIPDPYPRPWYKFAPREFWGTLAAAGLLSLGAPFWFNALKTLSSLRPILATKEESERKKKREATGSCVSLRFVNCPKSPMHEALPTVIGQSAQRPQLHRLRATAQSATAHPNRFLKRVHCEGRASPIRKPPDQTEETSLACDCFTDVPKLLKCD